MKRILHDFVIDKIAAVDRPCQEHATMAILKRAPTDAENAAVVKADAIAATSRALLKLKLDLLKVQLEKVSK